MSNNAVTWKKWLLLPILIAIGGILLFGPAKSSYHRFKESRSLTQAKSFFDKADYANAAISARQVLLLNPTNAQACRIMADLADMSQSPAALDYRRQLAEADPSPENKLKLAEAGLRYQSRPYPLTTQILEELSATTTNLPFYHVVAAEHALAIRQFATAEKQFAAAVALDPTNRLYQLNLAVVGLTSANPATLTAARDRLKSFVTDTNYSAAALRTLIIDRLAHDDAAGARDYSEQLLRTLRAPVSDRLQYLAILQKIQSADFPAQLDAVQQFAATNAPAAMQVVMWMQANGLATNAVNWTTRLSKSVRDQPAVELATALAIETMHDWPGLRQFCMRGNWNDFDFMRLAFLSRAWKQLGETTVAQSNWHTAVDAASGRFGALASLIDLTARWQMADERRELFWKMFQKFPRERWVSAALEEQCFLNSDTAGLNRIYRQLTMVFPDNAEFKNNLAYTCLLLRTNQVEAETLADHLYAQAPNDPTIASTHAFALHLRKRDAEGLAVLQKLSPEALKQPSLALCLGLLLEATGDHAGAQRALTNAHGSIRLLPEEKQLLDATEGRH